MRRLVFFIVVPIVFLSGYLSAQDPLRFSKEIEEIIARDSLVKKENIILFTGSSTIRFWSDLPSQLPAKNIVMHGFGGSEASDLLYYADRLIIDYHPVKIFIYEGDNDLNSGKKPEEVMLQIQQIQNLIRTKLPKKTKVYWISAKPSPSRWKMKAQYELYNQKMKEWCSSQKKTKYIDLWTPMLNEKGEVKQELFLGDNLHMNKTGYQLWLKKITRYL